MSPAPPFRLLFVVGPTACGKTELAVQAVESARGRRPLPLLNCDSVQVFASIDVGAAKPSAAQLARAPHRLLSFVPEGHGYTAGDYRKDATAEIDRLREAGVHGALVVGGSGFYARALEVGMPEAPPSDPLVKAGIEARAADEGLLALHRELARKDPERAARVAPADHYRIVRALEIMALQPRTLTELERAFAESRGQPTFAVRKIGLMRSRESMRRAVEVRVAGMLADDGLLVETESFRRRGLGEWAPLRSVGYKEAQAVLDGKLSGGSLHDAVVTSTMQLAKRQMTWFRRDPDVDWHDVDSLDGRRRALDAIRDWTDGPCEV